MPRSLPGFHPNAILFWIDLAMPIGQNPTARSVTQVFGAGHRTGHARMVKHTLTTHAAVKNRLLGELLQSNETTLRPTAWREPTAERQQKLVSRIIEKFKDMGRILQSPKHKPIRLE